MMNRLIRRIIVRYFGSTKNFLLWTAAVILTIYVIDTYILTRDRLENIVKGPRDIKLPQVSHPAIEQPPPDPGAKMPSTKGAGNTDKQGPKVAPAIKVEQKPLGRCGLKHDCPAGKFAYAVKSGLERDGSPTICFDGHTAMAPGLDKNHRGINVVVVNDKTHKIVETRYFDTYVEESALVRFLKMGVQNNHLILAASQDEASNGLKEDGRAWMRKYGSGAVDRLGFRDAFAMVGQRGLTHGSAIEKLNQRGEKEFSEQADISGCVSIPMGKINDMEHPSPPQVVEEKEKVKAGDELDNCGVKENCGESGFSVHLYSGNKNIEGPKICVNGKYVMAKGLNDGGRGFNIVIIDSKKKEVVRVGHFDTYAEDASNLEIFLEMINPGEIVAAVTHDDASKNLNAHVKKLFQDLGSSQLTKFNFRDVWGFVGQKGLKGFSGIEQVEFAGPGSSWPKPIDKRQCVPVTLTGTKVKPDPMANKNEKRRAFCAKNDGYGIFCSADNIDDPLTPAPLVDKSLEKNPIFLVPIIVVPGLNYNAFRMQLETVLMQPGINPNMVMVMYDEKFSEPAALADVFGFKSEKLNSSSKYAYQLIKAIEIVWDLYPTAEHVIVLEEEVILAVDFLSFMSQCLLAVQSDDSLVGISGWNENGYEGVSTLPGVAYRTETFPAMAFLLKKKFYVSEMKGKMNECCVARSWDGWLNGKLNDKEMIIPDVSRAYRCPYETLSEQADMLKELFNRKRITNLEPSVKITNSKSLTSAEYEAEMTKLVKEGKGLDTTNVQDCLHGRGLGFYIPAQTGNTYVIYFEQADNRDHRILGLLARCFKLYYNKGHSPRGLHKNTLRFSYTNNTILLVGQSSPYYKYKPDSLKPVAITSL